MKLSRENEPDVEDIAFAILARVQILLFYIVLRVYKFLTTL